MKIELTEEEINGLLCLLYEENKKINKTISLSYLEILTLKEKLLRFRK